MEKFCSQCGAELYSEARYCHACGAPKSANQISPSPLPADLTPRAASTLSYLLLFVSGALFLNLDPYRKDPIVRFHAWQSVYFGIAWMALSVLHNFLFFGFLFLWMLQPLLHLAFLVVWVVLMVRVYNGEKWMLPVIGNWAEKKAALLP